MTLKEEIYRTCLNMVNNRVSLLQKALDDLTESAANETKSTAGDKHETALAMLQIEQENTGRQLKNALENKLVLNRINIQHSSPTIITGSLIKTSQGYLFISVALGKITVGNIGVVVLSAQSPLGKKLSGLKINDTAEMNSTTYLIENIH